MLKLQATIVGQFEVHPSTARCYRFGEDSFPLVCSCFETFLQVQSHYAPCEIYYDE